MSRTIETLVGIRAEDLGSPEPEVRRKALETSARNERILWGRVSQRTESQLRLLGSEQLPELPSDKPR
jgi:hypothetical protein